jgi:GNAT superfamily N-acetyltransferase
MTLKSRHEEPIDKRHHRQAFDCGDAALNEFLRRYARQNHESGAAKTFVAVSGGDHRTILGYYTLAPASIAYSRTPELLRRGLARHEVPAFRLARLAVDRRAQGHGLGGQLLLSAGKRCLLASAEVGGVAMLIDAKNEGVAAWYTSYGAVPLLDAPLSLVLPLATIRVALQSAKRL